VPLRKVGRAAFTNGVDFYRTSLGGRSFEYMTGEDPLIGATLLPAEINGMQSQMVMATRKPYACNDQEINRLAINVVVDQRTLRELPPAVRRRDTRAFGRTAWISTCQAGTLSQMNSTNLLPALQSGPAFRFLITLTIRFGAFCVKLGFL
jgi:hypothetical protein